MLENIVGKRYAQALSETVKDTTRLEPVLGSLRELSQAFETEKRLKQFFANPSTAAERKRALAAELCEKLKVDAEVRRLLETLALRKKVLYLPKIAEHFQKEVDGRLDQVRVVVKSAAPLENEQKDKLAEQLNKALGKKKVLMDVQEDASLIGGLVLHIDGLVVDTSLKNRLTRLKQIIEKKEVA